MKKLVLFLIIGIPMWAWCQRYELPMTSKKDLVFRYSAYSVLFDKTTNIPRWVAWNFSAKKRSNIQVSRSGNEFTPDPHLGPASPLALHYTNSGYDRGHMCPANDCLWSGKALEESFYMSNICPQTPALNRGKGRKGLGSAWYIVEEKCHNPWADHYKTLYIVAGPIPNEMRGTIPFCEGKSILVPKRFFKAIVGVTKNNTYHGIGFIFTQECGVEIVSIDRVEQLTRLDLFYQIDKSTQNKIEKVSSFSEKDWPGLSVIRQTNSHR